jgi:ABC-type Mn2+/Zn2+ transport system ATPase subunit
MLDAIEDKDFVVINVDEIFSTMDKKYAKAFSSVFLNELINKGKYAIIISHNHDFNKEMSSHPLVNTLKFDSYIDDK